MNELKTLDWSDNISKLLGDYGNLKNIKEPTEEEKQDLINTEKQLKQDFEGFTGKLDQVGYIKNKFDDEELILKNELNRLNKRLKQVQNGRGGLFYVVGWAMRSIKIPKFKTAFFTFSFRKSTQVIVPEDIETIPTNFLVKKTLITADKMAIKNALKAGQIVAHCSLLEKESLQIK